MNKLDGVALLNANTSGATPPLCTVGCQKCMSLGYNLFSRSSKTGVTVEPMMQFLNPSGFRMS